MEEGLFIEAAARPDGTKGYRVKGLAYSGGKMPLPGWRHPVVVDLAGLEVPDSVPLLANHENRTGSRVGLVKPRLKDNELHIEGDVLSSSGVAGGIVEQAKAGGEWQLSIGADVLDSELVQGQRFVNGRMQQEPFFHVKKAVLREVSVVAVGADDGTHMRLAAKFILYARMDGQGGEAMEFEKWLEAKGIAPKTLDDEKRAQLKAEFEKESEQPRQDAAPPPAPKPPKPHVPKQEPAKPAPVGKPSPARHTDGGQAPQPAGEPGKGPETSPEAQPNPSSDGGTPSKARVEAEKAVKAERDRVGAIQEICAGEYPEIEREAIKAGWDREQTSRKVLKAMRGDRPQADVSLSVNGDRGREHDQHVLEAALCLRAGISEDTLLKTYGEPVLEAAWGNRDLSLQQLFVECARIEGVPVPRTFSTDTIRAAFSTESLPGLLSNVANKRLMKSFAAQPVIATQLCSEGELNDFKESQRYRLTDVGDLQPVAPDGELKHGSQKEDKATNQLGTFGKLFTLTRQMIYNDDLGAFLKVPEGMGARAARKIDQLFFTRLLSNPNGLFAAGHGNYMDGADTALAGDSLALAVQMFLDQTDSDGQPINVTPKFLLVPTALKMTGRELLKSTMFIAVGSTNKQRIPTYNALAEEELLVVASPYLSNTQYTGASSKAWYLFADPTIVDTFEIGYLKGRRTPTVERGETDFDTLGIKFRVYFDLGVREQDYRGMVKFKGEA